MTHNSNWLIWLYVHRKILEDSMFSWWVLETCVSKFDSTFNNFPFSSRLSDVNRRRFIYNFVDLASTFRSLRNWWNISNSNSNSKCPCKKNIYSLKYSLGIIAITFIHQNSTNIKNDCNESESSEHWVPEKDTCNMSIDNCFPIDKCHLITIFLVNYINVLLTKWNNGPVAQNHITQ